MPLTHQLSDTGRLPTPCNLLSAALWLVLLWRLSDTVSAPLAWGVLVHHFLRKNTINCYEEWRK